MERGTGRPKLLVHVCCAPCSTACVERLTPEYEVVLFWYNPNITDREEYERRLAEVRRYAAVAGIQLVEGAHEPERWEDAAQGLLDEPEGGRRCDRCYRLRLERAAQVAEGMGIGQFTTTLTISPHKPLGKVAAAARAAVADGSLRFLAEDFKKQRGFERSTELSRKHDLYRQDFCGCEPSRRERDERRRRHRT